jgi:hypothetical protein
VLRGDSIAAVAKEHLCGHVFPARREHGIMEDVF